MTANFDRELALQAMLAEYETLRTEIQNRSELQNRFLQLHVTTISIVVGLLLQNEFGIYPGFIVVIAVSYSVFGLWWTDQAVTIHRIGRHLADPVEQDVNALIGASVLRWESEDRNPVLRKFNETSMLKGFNWLVLRTYMAPAAVTLFITIIVLWNDRQTLRELDFDKEEVWVVAFLVPFVVAIFIRMWMSRGTMIQIGEYSDCYKRQLRNEPLNDVCQQKLATLEGMPEWVARQKRNRQKLRGDASTGVEIESDNDTRTSVSPNS